MFGTATRLAVLLAGRNPKWSEQDSFGGAPSVDDAGIFLENAPLCWIDVQLRENLKYRRGRITVTTVADSETYNVEVRQSTASYNSDGDATEVEVVEGIVQEVNALRLDVHARAIDEDSDNDPDTVYLESNNTAIHIDTLAASETYSVTVNGYTASQASDGTPSDEEVLDPIVSDLNASAAPVRAYGEDTTGDGNTDTIFLEPVEAESLEVAVSATGSGSIVIDAAGKEGDNPHYGLPGSTGSAELALDADAVEVDLLFFVTHRGDASVPEGWRLEDSISSVGYRGTVQPQQAAGRERGYVQIINRDEGTVRSVSIGPATLEDT